MDDLLTFLEIAIRNRLEAEFGLETNTPVASWEPEIYDPESPIMGFIRQYQLDQENVICCYLL